MAKYALTKREREELQSEVLMRQIAEMYLDPFEKYTLEQMAEATGLTLDQVRYMVSKEQFAEIYAQTLETISGRARLSIRHAISSDALLKAYREHLAILDSGETLDSVKMTAIREIYKISQMYEPDDSPADDRRKLQKFQDKLQGQWNIQQVNIFTEALGQVLPLKDQPVDAEFQEIQDDPSTDEDTEEYRLGPGPQDQDDLEGQLD